MQSDLWNYYFQNEVITLSDGVKLSVTIAKPVPRNNENFPILLEYSPWRKDDHSYMRDFELYDFFGE